VTLDEVGFGSLDVGRWEKANPHEGPECLLGTGGLLQAIGKR
jgi:hypothetical protein